MSDESLTRRIKQAIVGEREEYPHRIPFDPEPRYNPWAIQLAEMRHEQADTLEEIAEKLDDESDTKSLRGIAESIREEADVDEELYYE